MKNKRKVKLLTYCFFISSVIGCNSHEHKRLEGDLYFKLIDFPFHTFSDSVLTKLEESTNAIDWDTLRSNEVEYYKLIENLKANDLLRKPFIRLRKDNGEIVMVYLSESDYKKVNTFSSRELQENNKKVRIVSDVKVLKIDTVDIYINNELKLIQKIDGITYSKK